MDDWSSSFHCSSFDTEPTSPCPILIMQSARLGSDKYQFLSHYLDLSRVQTGEVQIPWHTKLGDRHATHLAIPSDYRKEPQIAVVCPCFPFIRSGQDHFERYRESCEKTTWTKEKVARHHGMVKSSILQWKPYLNLVVWCPKEPCD